MKKKLLSVLMVLCLILAMAPAAMAEGDGDFVCLRQGLRAVRP